MNRQNAPDMNQNGQQNAPDMNRQNAPDMNQNGQQNAPDMNQNGMPEIKQPFAPDGKNEPQHNFEQLLSDNVITQETYDSIIEYLENNKPTEMTPPEKPESTEAETSEQTDESADGQEAPVFPVKPEMNGQVPPAMPNGQNRLETNDGNMPADLLDALLENGVITEDTYNAILSAQTTPVTDASSQE